MGGGAGLGGLLHALAAYGFASAVCGLVLLLVLTICGFGPRKMWEAVRTHYRGSRALPEDTDFWVAPSPLSSIPVIEDPHCPPGTAYLIDRSLIVGPDGNREIAQALAERKEAPATRGVACSRGLPC